jgi:hypothetical protein
VLFGSDSQMRVQITPASDETTTVEQHLRSECETLLQRVQVSSKANVCRLHGQAFLMVSLRRHSRLQQCQEAATLYIAIPDNTKPCTSLQDNL